MKAGPMKIFAHLPACFRYWHFSHSLRPCRCDAYQEIQAIWAKLDEHSDGLDALDRGIVEAGDAIGATDERLGKVVEAIREEARTLWAKTDEIAEIACSAERQAAKANARIDRVTEVMGQVTGDPLPSYEVSRDELEAATPIPPGSNESLSRELDSTDEEMLAALATELWGHDEYLEIVAEHESQRNGGAS